MNMRLKLLAMLIVAVMWNACSDSDSGESGVNAVAASLEVVEKYDELPSCDDGRQGQEIYVSRENAVYACVKSKWRLTAKVNDVNTSVPTVCKTKALKDSSGVQVICGDSLVVEIHNGTKGKKGVTGDKGETGVAGKDGAKGNKGATGEKGETGDKGAAGADGTNGTDGKNGEKGDDCTAIPLDDNSGLKIMCGNDSVAVIINGRDGYKGYKGSSCRVETNVVYVYDSVSMSIKAIEGSERGYVRQMCDDYGEVNTAYDGYDANNDRDCYLETMDKSGLKVVCDNDSMGVILNGIDGKKGRNGIDGKNCVAEENKDGSGYTITCSGTLAADIEKASWANLNPNIEYDYFIDERDRQVYKIVKIGSQVWMAENLNYADSVKTPSLKGKSWCYRDNLDTCDKYGRLYSWAAAMDSVKSGCGYPKTCSVTYPVQGLCPDGWHVPDTSEWNKLFDYVGQNNAGVMLRSASDDWEYYEFAAKGVDEFGLSVVPAGYYLGWFESKGSSNYLWSSVEKSPDNAFSAYAGYSNYSMYNSDGRKNYGRSLRCIKNDSLLNKGQILNGRNGKNCSAAALEDGSGYIIACGDVPAKYVEKLSWQFLNPGVKYEMFLDDRDNQIYKMVKIGEQVWMAENLNYADSVKTPSLKNRTACYPNNDSQDSCKKYGRHYTWAAMMDSVNTGCGYGKSCSPSEPVQGICPNGWHLPTRTEWSTLINYVEKKYSSGYALKSQVFSGSDVYGFSSVPTGIWYSSDSKPYFGEVDSYGYIWTSSQYDIDYAYDRYWYMWSSWFDESYSSKINGLNVRCVKNDTLFVNSSFLGNGKDGTDGSDGTNGTSCVTETLPDGSGSRVVCEKETVGSISNGSEGTYCAVLPLWEGTKESSLRCGLKKGEAVPEKIPWGSLNPKIEYGKFVDKRDNQPYKTVKIGSQTWFAENLNYADSVKTPSLKANSWCYDNLKDNCHEYGRLYTWAATMDSENTGCGYDKECTPTYPVQGICPDGWHVPTKDEWNTLFEYVGGTEVAGKKLKSLSSDWYYYSDYTTGTDDYGFSVRPAGDRDYYGSFYNMGNGHHFWTSTESYSSESFSVYYEYSWRGMSVNDTYSKSYGFPVRCIMD